MKNRFLIFLMSSLFFISCKQNEENFNENLKTIILDYQKKYPIPNIKKKDPSDNSIYLYGIIFFKKENDTLIELRRTSSGIDSSFNGYGIYKDKELWQTVIIDNDSLSKDLIYNRLKNDSLSRYFRNDKEDYSEGFPPIYTYSITNKKIKLISIDTVWTRWD